MRASFHLLLAAVLALAGCTVPPFRTGTDTDTRAGAERTTRTTGSGPILSSPPEIGAPVPGGEPAIDAQPPPQLPRERPRAPPATLSPASKALVSQAQAQRKRGDLPGATVSLERALRIEPTNPLLWIEMGRLRMDQHNYLQAENMGRKALSMSVGDDRTQSAAWLLIADSFKARGKNPQAQEALEKSQALTPQ